MAKKKDQKSLSSMSRDELLALESDLRKQIFKMNMERATGQLANTAQVRGCRRDLARVLTCLSAKSRQVDARSV